MTDYEFVKDRTGGASRTGSRDLSCAMSPDGSTVYLAITPSGSSTGSIISMDWPDLDNETTVYSDPAGYDLAGVAHTASYPVAVLGDHDDGTIEVRELDDTVLWTSPNTGASTTGGGAVWNPVDSRLYVLFRRSGSARTELFSMDEDGTDVVAELDQTGESPIVPTRPIVTPDGAVWWVGALSGGNPRPERWTSATGLDVAGSSTPFSLGVVVEPNGSDVLTTFGSPFNTRQYKFESGSVLVDSAATPTITPPDVFDGYRMVHGAVSADFSRGVAFGVEPDDFNAGTVEDFRWWRFSAVNPWTVGRVQWGSRGSWH